MKGNPTMTTFQTNPFFPMPTGELSIALLDNNNAPAASVEAALPFQIRVSWNFNTNIPGWLIPVNIRAFADELGGGFDGAIPGVGANLGNLPSTGSTTLTVPANTFPDPPLAAGVYRITVVLAGADFASHDLSAFADVTAAIR